jgi:hypothetical protein
MGCKVRAFGLQSGWVDAHDKLVLVIHIGMPPLYQRRWVFTNDALELTLGVHIARRDYIVARALAYYAVHDDLLICESTVLYYSA